MPWTPPSDPVTNTVITVAYAVANLLTQIRWLRGMTGNADPPGSSYVVVSDSAGATSWRKVPPDALAAGAVVGNLGYTPINKAGDTGISGGLVLNNNVSLQGRDTGGGVRGLIGKGSDDNTYVGDAGSGFVILSSPTGLGALLANNTSLQGRDTGTAPRGLIGKGPDNNTYVGDAASGAVQLMSATGQVYVGAGTTNRVWHSGNDGAGSGLDAAMVGGRTPTAAVRTPGAIPITDAGGTLDGWVTGGGVPGPHTHSGDNLLPATLNGAPTSATPAAGAIPIADAGGKLAAGWLPAAGGGSDVPTNLIALWGVSNTAPTGWVLETSFQGRFPVAAGGALGLALGNTGGGSTHSHTTNIAHGHNDTISVGGAVSADGATGVHVTVVTPGDAVASPSGHGHGFTGSKGGSVTALNNPSNIASDAPSHLPPYYALNYIRKT